MSLRLFLVYILNRSRQAAPFLVLKKGGRYMVKTNNEILTKGTVKQKAHLLCSIIEDCTNCPVNQYCYKGHTGFIDWLETNSNY